MLLESTPTFPNLLYICLRSYSTRVLGTITLNLEIFKLPSDLGGDVTLQTLRCLTGVTLGHNGRLCGGIGIIYSFGLSPIRPPIF